MMRLRDDEIQEWHEHLLEERNRFKNFLQNIVIGVPTIPGMACEYRSYTLPEIKKIAKDLLNRD